MKFGILKKPGSSINMPERIPFTDRQLLMIVIPLFVERMLQMVVGLADTFVISYTGEAAVSGVSLVNQFNNVFIFVSTALAAGGSAITSQYIGSKKKEKADESCSQLVSISALIFIVFSVITLLFQVPILHFLFGKVETDVMEACLTYLKISAFSFPMIAVYDAGASLYRSKGKTSVTMYISIVSNIINVIGNCIGVFVLKAGVAGVAWPSLIARTFSAVMVTVLCLTSKDEIHYELRYIFRMNRDMLGRILHIAVPNGVENGIFQLVKVALSSMVSVFGTTQIAAYGISQTFWSLSNAFGNSAGPAFTTVIGQCMGDHNEKAAEYYFHHFNILIMIFGGMWNAILTLSCPGILHFYALSSDTKHLIVLLVILHNVFGFWLYPYWGATAFGLRAAGDVRFTMLVSVFSTVCVRLVFAYVLGVSCSMMTIGIVISMILDWCVRAIFNVWRVKSGKWKEFKLI